MAQYCRFCTYCTISDMTGGAYCDKKQKEMSESTAKHTNKCKDYEEHPLGGYGKDFYGEKKLVSRKPKKEV